MFHNCYQVKRKKKEKEGGKNTYTINKDTLGTGFFPRYWPCKPWGKFSPWYTYLVHKRCWFFSAARHYYIASNFFTQSLPHRLAVLAGTKQLFMRNDNGPLRFRGYYTFSISYLVPKLFHFAIPDTTWLRLIHQLNRWIPYKLMKFRILTSASRVIWYSMEKLLRRLTWTPSHWSTLVNEIMVPRLFP